MNCSRLTKWMGYLLLPIILIFASQTELSAQSKKITLKSSEYKNGKTTFVWELKTSKNSKLNFSGFNDCVDEDDVDDVKDKEKDEDEDDDEYRNEKSEKSTKSNYRYNSGKSKKNKFSLSQYFSSKSKQDDDDRSGPSNTFDGGKLKVKTITLVLVGKYKSKTISFKRKVSNNSSEDQDEQIDIPVKVHSRDRDDDNDGDHDGDHEICEGEEIESDDKNGNNYRWSKLNDNSFSQSSRNFKPSSAGSYSLSYSDEDGCENEEEHEVIIKKKTEITAQPIAPAAVCIGATPGTLSVTAVGQGTLTYQWYKDGVKIEGATSSSYSPSGSVAGSFQYYVVVKGECGEKESDKVTVVVNALPAVTTTLTENSGSSSSDNAVCQGASAMIIATPGTPGTYNFSWTHPVGASNPGNVGSFSATVAGTYSASITNTSTGCVSVASGVTLIVNPLPTITASQSAKAVCYSTAGQATPLTYSAITNAPTTYSISWAGTPANSFATVTDANLPSSPLSIAVPAGTAAGTYTGTLFVKNANVCSSNGVAFTITVYPKPSKHDDHKEDRHHGSVSKEVSLKPAGSNRSNWYWRENGMEKSGNTSPKPSTETSGVSYKYEYSETNSDGCEGDRSGVDIRIVSVPYYTFTQSYYGSKKGKVCIITEVKDGKATKTTTYNKPIDLINASLSKLTGFTLKLGEKGGKDGYKGMFVITRNESSNLNAMLPMSGKSDAIREIYECNSNDKKTKEKAFKVNNELLGQVISLALNTGIPDVGDDLGNFDLSKAGDQCIITKRAPGCVDRKEEKYDREEDDDDDDDRDDDKKRFISAKVLNAVAGDKSVNDLVKFAIDVLFDKSKLPVNVSYKDVAKTLKALNESFEHGRFFVKFDKCRKGDDDDDDRKSRSAAMTMIGAQEEMGASSNGGSVSVAVGVFPNPYNDKISFRLKARQTAKSSLVVYNMLGQKIANLFEGEMQANTTTNIEYNVPAAQRKNLVFVFRNGTYSTTGKLIKAN